MYYQNYEDYMRSVLGYPVSPTVDNTGMYIGENSCGCMPMATQPIYSNNCNNNLEAMYPEVYRVVYPFVCSACGNAPSTITEEWLENTINDISRMIEQEGKFKVEVNVKAEFKNGDVRNPNAKMEREEETRQIRNNFLGDLIRILILRELLNRPGRPRPPFPGPGMPPPRPPFPGGPGRPPFPGGPGGMPPRPQPRDYINF